MTIQVVCHNALVSLWAIRRKAAALRYRKFGNPKLMEVFPIWLPFVVSRRNSLLKSLNFAPTGVLHLPAICCNAIYREVDQEYQLLAERIGWRRGDEWITYNNVTFNRSAPVGHLPLTWLVPTSFWMYWSARIAFPGWRLLLKRVDNCQRSKWKRVCCNL